MKSTFEYENLTEIGRGSFATVYKASTRSNYSNSFGYSLEEVERSSSLSKQEMEKSQKSDSSYLKSTIKTGQMIAIKVVNRTKLNRKLQENLDMEIKILRKARHRNVVTLYHVIVGFL